MAHPQKKLELAPSQEASKRPHADLKDSNQMQKHQKELIDWLMEMDAQEASHFFSQQYLFVR